MRRQSTVAAVRGIYFEPGRHLQTIVGARGVIEASLHESLEPGPGGKFRAVMSLCRPA
jgi:hypothetical protein